MTILEGFRGKAFDYDRVRGAEATIPSISGKSRAAMATPRSPKVPWPVEDPRTFRAPSTNPRAVGA
jgi:hypothetical protein